MIVDANVLLYSVDTQALFHAPAKRWLEEALNGPIRIGFPWPTLLAFQRISTHPKASVNPLTTEQAWDFISDWLAAEQAWIPQPTSRHAVILRQLVVSLDLRGNLVSDAHLAALAMEYGVGICSFDSDFARFPALKWHRPEISL